MIRVCENGHFWDLSDVDEDNLWSYDTCPECGAPMRDASGLSDEEIERLWNKGIEEAE